MLCMSSAVIQSAVCTLNQNFEVSSLAFPAERKGKRKLSISSCLGFKLYLLLLSFSYYLLYCIEFLFIECVNQSTFLWSNSWIVWVLKISACSPPNLFLANLLFNSKTIQSPDSLLYWRRNSGWLRGVLCRYHAIQVKLQTLSNLFQTPKLILPESFTVQLIYFLVLHQIECFMQNTNN